MKENDINKIDYISLIYLLIGSILLSIGINLFIAPHNLAFGGVTGITIIAKSLIGIPISISNLVLSMCIIFLGWFALGREFMLKTIIPTILLPLLLSITSPLQKCVTSLHIAAIFGALTVGTGIGLTILAGGSTAGPDTIGLVLKKHFHIPVTLTMIIIDTSVIICGWGVYGTNTAVWSIIVAILMNITVKLVRDVLSKKMFFRYWHKQNKNLQYTDE